MQFLLNNSQMTTERSPGTVTLDYIRNHALLKGTKEVCREGDCGACTVLVGELSDELTVRYKAVCSCILPLGELEGKHLVTIEGINQEVLTPIQQAFVDYGATQCGFCTPGFVMSLTGCFLNSPTFDAQSLMDAIAGNVCRCTGYASIIRAVNALRDQFKDDLLAADERVSFLIEQHILPEYFKEVPARLQSIQESRQAEKTSQEDAVCVAGATDLYVQRPDEFKDAAIYFTLQDTHLSRMWTDEQFVYVGAGVATEEFTRHELLLEHLPQLSTCIPRIASKLIRERATLAGNIVNASPIGDMSIILLALDAELGLCQNGSERTLPLKTFYTGYKTFDLRESERIEWIRIPRSATESRVNFEKVCKRSYLDIASVNSAIALTTKDTVIESASLSAGGVSPVPFYLKNTSEFLSGKAVSAETVREAVNIAEGEIAPISDVRGSKAYKAFLLRQFIVAHFITLFPEQEDECSQALTASVSNTL